MVEYDHSMQVETEIQENHLQRNNISKTEAYAILEERKEMRN